MATLTGPRALTVRRPWAGLLVAGVKPVENRGWTTTYRGPLFIHAGQAWVHAGQQLAAEQGITVTCDEPTGYIGAVRLVDIHPAADCCAPWGEPDGYHWTVVEPIRFEQPISGKGRLGLFRVPADVLDQINEG